VAALPQKEQVKAQAKTAAARVGKEISDTRQRNKFEGSIYQEISNFKRF